MPKVMHASPLGKYEYACCCPVFLYTIQSLVTVMDVVFLSKLMAFCQSLIFTLTSIILIITLVSLFHLRRGFSTSISVLSTTQYVLECIATLFTLSFICFCVYLRITP